MNVHIKYQLSFGGLAGAVDGVFLWGSGKLTHTASRVEMAAPKR